jgi:hypothetical protein
MTKVLEAAKIDELAQRATVARDLKPVPVEAPQWN